MGIQYTQVIAHFHRYFICQLQPSSILTLKNKKKQTLKFLFHDKCATNKKPQDNNITVFIQGMLTAGLNILYVT